MEQRALWFAPWMHTDAGRSWVREACNHELEVDADGKFTAHGLLPGTCTRRVSIMPEEMLSRPPRERGGAEWHGRLPRELTIAIPQVPPTDATHELGVVEIPMERPNRAAP